MDNWNSFLLSLGIFAVIDLILVYSLYLLYRKMESNSFGLHIVFCDQCDRPQIVPFNVVGLYDCRDCHICDACSVEKVCLNCGRTCTVREDEDMSFCNGVGCFETWKKKQNAQNKKNKKSTQEK